MGKKLNFSKYWFKWLTFSFFPPFPFVTINNTCNALGDTEIRNKEVIDKDSNEDLSVNSPKKVQENEDDTFPGKRKKGVPKKGNIDIFYTLFGYLLSKHSCKCKNWFST